MSKNLTSTCKWPMNNANVSRKVFSTIILVCVLCYKPVHKNRSACFSSITKLNLGLPLDNDKKSF